MGTYARWQMALGKTFMAGWARHDGAAVGCTATHGPPRVALLCGMTEFPKVGHELAARKPTPARVLYETAVTAGLDDATDEEAKSIPREVKAARCGRRE